jgi:hypothetical protein
LQISSTSLHNDERLITHLQQKPLEHVACLAVVLLIYKGLLDSSLL